MADALCGPSNALQNFQKHTLADRTLQQDRFIARQSPLQVCLVPSLQIVAGSNASLKNFRSVPSNAGALEPEFEAFQAGVPVGALDRDLSFLPPREFAPSASRVGPQIPNWASDFQNLRISRGHTPTFQQAFNQHSGNAASAWHSDFLQHQATPNPSYKQDSQFQNSFNGYQRYTSPGFYGLGQSSSTQSPSVLSQHREIEEKAKQFNDADFERAFEAAQAEALAELEKGQDAGHAELGQDVLIEETAVGYLGDMAREDFSHETNHLAAEAQLEGSWQEQGALQDIPQEQEQTEQGQSKDEGDELALTAGQLLDSVAHDTSQKFQESQFLALMRRLRDREVRVEGDQMVDASSTHHPSIEPAPAPIPSYEQDHDPGRAIPRNLSGILYAPPFFDTNTDADDHVHDMGEYGEMRQYP